jgi:hypothetical protein
MASTTVSAYLISPAESSSRGRSGCHDDVPSRTQLWNHSVPVPGVRPRAMDENVRSDVCFSRDNECWAELCAHAHSAKHTLSCSASAPVFVDLTTQPVTSKGTLHLSPLPGEGANQPDALGGGDPIVSGVLPVSLRAAGQLAFVDVVSLAVRSYLPIASPAQFNQATCIGCAVHGVSVRPGAVAYAH